MHVTICRIISRACVNFLSTIKVKIIILVICVSMLRGAWSLPSTMPLKFCVFPTFRCAQPKYCSLPNSANGQLATNMEILNCDMVTGFLLVNPTCLLNYKIMAYLHNMSSNPCLHVCHVGWGVCLR